MRFGCFSFARGSSCRGAARAFQNPVYTTLAFPYSVIVLEQERDENIPFSAELAKSPERAAVGELLRHAAALSHCDLAPRQPNSSDRLESAIGRVFNYEVGSWSKGLGTRIRCAATNGRILVDVQDRVGPRIERNRYVVDASGLQKIKQRKPDLAEGDLSMTLPNAVSRSRSVADDQRTPVLDGSSALERTTGVGAVELDSLNELLRHARSTYRI